MSHALQECSSIAEEGRGHLQQTNTRIEEMASNELQLLQERKHHLEDLGKIRKQILKYKGRFEEVSHHVNVFSTGVDCVLKDEGPEEMRCSFNELRRVNAGLEERLILAGVSKQKIMNDLRDELDAIRASCSQNPARSSNHVPDEVLEDLNLTTQGIRDMNKVCKASLPSVSSISDNRRHAEMLSFLASSMGFFASDCLDDIVDSTLSSNKTHPTEALYEEERGRLFGVISVETHRYRTITASLQAAVKDAELLLDPSRYTSVGSVISAAAASAVQRLSCSIAFIWRKSNDKCYGFLNLPYDSAITYSSQTQDAVVGGRQRFSPANINSDLSMDIHALLSSGVLTNSLDEYESLSVTYEREGMTVVRNCSKDPPFLPFEGIYCEQFLRRVVSAIAPMQRVQIRRIADQRPLDLVQCLFELRCAATTPLSTIELSSDHLGKLFRAQDLRIFIPVESEPGKALALCREEILGNDIVADLDPNNFLSDNCSTKGIFPVKHTFTLKQARASVAADDGEASFIKLFLDEPDHKIVFPVFKGRQLLMFLEWSHPITLPCSNEGFDNDELWSELRFDHKNADHKTILTEYVGVLEGLLAQWFKGCNSLFYQSQEITSYLTEDDHERETIAGIVQKTRSQVRD